MAGCRPKSTFRSGSGQVLQKDIGTRSLGGCRSPGPAGFVLARAGKVPALGERVGAAGNWEERQALRDLALPASAVATSELVYGLAPFTPGICFPDFPGICFRMFPGYGLYESSLNLVRCFDRQTKSRVELSKLYFGLWFSLIGALPWLNRFVRVGYVCLLPGPP
jgi:hypothetical protein